MSYAEQQIALGWVEWVDPADPRKGVICRDLLNFGGRPKEVPLTIGNILPSIEAPGTRYQGPPTPKVVAVFRSGLRIRAKLWAKAAAIA